MKYIIHLIEFIMTLMLWIAAFDFYKKGLNTFAIVFMILGLNRLDISNLSMIIKMKGKQNEK